MTAKFIAVNDKLLECAKILDLKVDDILNLGFGEKIDDIEEVPFDVIGHSVASALLIVLDNEKYSTYDGNLIKQDGLSKILYDEATLLAQDFYCMSESYDEIFYKLIDITIEKHSN